MPHVPARLRSARVLAVTLPLLAACSGGGQPPGPRPPVIDGTPTSATLSADQQAEVDRLTALLNESDGLTADQLLARRAVPFQAQLGYDPKTAKNLDLIQASALKLDAAELAGLSKNGFVISDKRRYPHFGYGYKTVYSQDLPVYISADSILQAVHQSYDDILKALELEALIPELRALLTGMRGRLTGMTALDAQTHKDVDLFLTVAAGLLDESTSATGLAKQLIDKGKAASGMADIALFGVEDRIIDFSQFKPRGHYTDDPRLESYFRAMIWLGRIDFPFIHTDSATSKQVLVRQSVNAAFALRALLDDAALARWKRLDRTIRAFVGEPDSMAPPEIDRLKADLGLAAYDVSGVSDAALAQAIVAGSYGQQKILSQIVIQAPHDGPWPLDAVFLFFGQRYTFDSHVFSNVVYDRVERRMMPNPLDVAYAALGNDQAAKLLESELRKYPYVPALESMRRLGDEHGDAFWGANLYNLWQGALRALSPTADIAQGGGLPAVARTEAWGRRMLNTQLASWAQLRHDTILYVKQSYTSGVACEFPDAYVDPYPAFYARLQAFAQAGQAVTGELPLSSTSYLGGRIGKYFGNLLRVTTTLREMAELQRQGQPYRPEHLAFINQAVDTMPIGCGGPPGLQGWYADLFFNPETALEFDPTIADVHTQPTDEAGNPVGHVLHVGTGWVRSMITTVDTCMGPRAYAGVVYSYHEHITKDLERLDDPTWAKRFDNNQVPDDVSWMQDLIVK
jgi:Protein of unknown function (DUF3160)